MIGLEFPTLNKFEKEQKVIELHKQGKTYKEISIQAHKNFRDIKKIITAYERKEELQAKREESNQSTQPKKPPISTQAFKLFREGKKLTDVTIELEIPARKAVKLWSQFLKLERMSECYEFYQDYQYEIPQLLTISSFIKRNNIEIEKIITLLKNVKDILNLQSYHSHLKNEIGKSEQIKKNYIASQNTKFQLHPMQPLPRYPSWNGYY